MTALIDAIARRLAPDEPVERVPRETAGVAVIFRRRTGPGRRGTEEEESHYELLLIKRVERHGDPWSGHVAFPGGRVEPVDASFRETATRETQEEVGIQLASARFLGYMGPFEARSRPMRVVPSVFVVQGEPEITESTEVQSHRWVGFEELLDARNSSTFTWEGGGTTKTFPAFELSAGYTVWGLTERIIARLTEFASSG